MRKIVFATGNSGKLREASEILGEGFQLVPLTEIGVTDDIPETGKTLLANSLQKAQYVLDHCGCDCFADDTGLEVDALGLTPRLLKHRALFQGEGRESGASDCLCPALTSTSNHGLSMTFSNKAASKIEPDEMAMSLF